jgi:hypothetical protein
VAPPFRITYRARTDTARARTRRLRKAIGKDARQIMHASAERRIVPLAERRAPSPARGTIVARATTRSVYITTKARGKRRRIVGLLEFGGTVRAWIRPGPGKKAIAFPGRGGETVFVAVVKGPRTYRPQHFMRDAVERGRGRVLRDIRREMPRAIRRHLGDVASVSE